MFSKRFLKIMSGTLIFSLVISSMVGCKSSKTTDTTQNTTNNSTTQNQQTTQKSSNGFPISEKPITLKIMKPLVMYDTEYSKVPVLQDFEKKSNITIEWNNPAQADFNDKYKLVMASGNLPDAMIAIPADDIEKYGQQGAFIPLNDLIDKHMPNLKKVFETYPDARKIVTGSDGKIYSFPQVMRQVWGNNALIIREDWLKKLNLQMPTTTDEWYNVLKAFKTGDPNGNGQADELPFSGDNIGDAKSLVTAWAVSTGFYVADKLAPKDGKVHYGPMEPRFKEAIEWVNKLYTEGLIDREILTNDVKAFQATMTQNKAGSTRGAFGGDLITMNQTAQKNGDTNFHLVAAPVMKGPHGDQFHLWPDAKAVPQGFVITRNNKYPVETAKWVDYWYSEEGQKFMWGIEGKTYTMKDGKPQWTDEVTKNPTGKTPAEVWGSYTPGRSTWPSVWLPAELVLQYDSEEVRYAKEKILTPNLLIEPIPTRLSFPQKDNDRRTKLMTDITTYVDESITNFIIGKRPLSDWDNYVKQLESMGIKEVIDIYQRAHDEWKKR